jgi:hypothetical protein
MDVDVPRPLGGDLAPGRRTGAHKSARDATSVVATPVADHPAGSADLLRWVLGTMLRQEELREAVWSLDRRHAVEPSARIGRVKPGCGSRVVSPVSTLT